MTTKRKARRARPAAPMVIVKTEARRVDPAVKARRKRVAAGLAERARSARPPAEQVNLEQHGRSGATVVVASRLPWPVVCRIFRMCDDREAVPGGWRHARVAKPADEFVVNGVSPTPPAADGLLRASQLGPAPPLVGGYALTHGVRADLWHEFVRQAGPDFAPLASGAVFAMPTAADATDKARECETLRSGLERLDQDNDPRTPRVRAGLEKPRPFDGAA